MALETEPFLITVGLMITGAFVGSLVFRHFRIPDIILLIALGVALGPILHFVDVEVFRAIVPLVSTIAIVIILFDGGLKMNVQEMFGGVASGSFLALLVFSATAILASLVGRHLIGLPWELALLLGMALGGAGVVIVIPLIQQMGVTDKTRTIVSIEAATSDVFVVIAVVGFSTALALQETDPGSLVRSLVQTFSIGILFGVASGAFWARALRRFAQRSYEYVLTMATLFLLYAVVELLGGSGALSVLSFGLVVGNSRKARSLAKDTEMAPRSKPRRGWVYEPVFGVDLVNLHHEMVFFVRAFFFVALGVVINLAVLTTPRFLLAGFLLSLAVVVARLWGVLVVFGRSRMARWDKLAVTLMFPLGLAAAALSVVPYERFGLVGTQDFGSYAAAVIVFTNLLSSILVFVASNERVRAKYLRVLDEPSVRAAGA